MKFKRSYLTLFVAAFFIFTVTVSADCPLGQNTMKDLYGALKIFRIAAPLLMLAYTIFDMIKLLATGMSPDGKETPPPKQVVQRFVKRLAAVVLLFVLPTLLNLLFIWAGVYDSSGNCNIDDPSLGVGSSSECSKAGGTWDDTRKKCTLPETTTTKAGTTTTTTKTTKNPDPRV